MQKKIVILCPLFNDGDSFNRLAIELNTLLGNLSEHQFNLVVVNDGSTQPLEFTPATSFPVQVLHLHRNIGHQKALAIGLAYVRENMDCDKVLIMDTDGEDKPTDVPELLFASDRDPGHIIFAARQSRQEGRQFRIFYQLYKAGFHLLTGKRISFGNFLIIPRPALEKIVYYSEIWSHLAGAIIKSGLPYKTLQTHRGKRFSGTSHMDFNRLLMHGMGAISVFMEVIASRLLLLSFFLIGFSLLVIISLVALKVLSDWTIPGWTSTVMSSMLVVLLQSFLLSLFTLFLYFSAESQRKFIPAHHYKDFTGPVETITR